MFGVDDLKLESPKTGRSLDESGQVELILGGGVMCASVISLNKVDESG